MAQLKANLHDFRGQKVTVRWSRQGLTCKMHRHWSPRTRPRNGGVAGLPGGLSPPRPARCPGTELQGRSLGEARLPSASIGVWKEVSRAMSKLVWGHPRIQGARRGCRQAQQRRRRGHSRPCPPLAARPPGLDTRAGRHSESAGLCVPGRSCEKRPAVSFPASCQTLPLSFGTGRPRLPVPKLCSARCLR